MDWCILRTSGRTTLRLADTLATDGFDVWTPREVRKIRIPRANIRREATLPLMPSYVFARSHHLVDLLELAQMEVKPRRGNGWGEPAHAGFSVMHWNDGIPLIADRHLDRLRLLEIKRTPRKKADRKFDRGVDVRVKIEGGSFAGMKGRVEKSDEGSTLVCFDERLTVKIATFLLDADSIGNETPCDAITVRRAA
jgi:transcription antitermination factor NusG